MTSSPRKQLTESESEHMLVALSVYTVMCRAQNRASLSHVILGLQKSGATADEILADLFETEDPSALDQVLALCDAAYDHLEKQRLINQDKQTTKRKRFTPPAEERYRLAAEIRKAVDDLYPTMPNYKATYEALAEESLELFGYKLSAGTIEGRYRWIKARPDERW